MPGIRIGTIKGKDMFNKRRSAGIDVKVPSTSDPEMLIWVNARTEENCRLVAAVNTVISF